MSNGIVRAAIEGALKAWADAKAPAIRCAFQKIKFTPVAGETFVRGFLMPANTLNPSQGGVHKHFHGMYQVSIYSPIDGTTGVGPDEILANEIEVLFKCGTTILKSGRNVNFLRSPSTSQGIPNDQAQWMTPVTIWYDMDDFS